MSLAVILILTVGVAIAIYLLRPMSTNLLAYMLWRITYKGVRQRGRIKRAGATIGYTSVGDAVPVVLLHGGLSSSLAWFSQTPYFISEGRRLILIDTRGHGVSTLGRAKYTYKNLAEDAIAVLDDLNLEKSDFVGWSDGGNTALRVAEQFPERINRMVLVSANYSPQGLIDPTFANLEGGWIARFAQKLQGSGHSELIHKVKHLWKNYPQLTESHLAEIQVPTLVVVGEDDAISFEHTRKMVEALPKAELCLIHDAGHMALMTHADEFNRRTLDFLNRQSPH